MEPTNFGKLVEKVKALDGWDIYRAFHGEPDRVLGRNAYYKEHPWESGRNSDSFCILTREYKGMRAGTFHDFARNDHCDAIEAVERTLRCDFNTAIRKIAERMGVNTVNQPVDLPRAGIAIPTWDELAQSYGLEWQDFLDRGCTWEARRKVSRFEPPFVRYPIRLLEGRVVHKVKTAYRLADEDGKTKRQSRPDPPKTEWQKGLFDCGLDECRGAVLVIAEGEEKAIAAAKAGHPAVSLADGATGFTEQAAEMVRNACPAIVVLAFDADHAGVLGIDKTRKLLAAMEVANVRTIMW